MLKLISCLAGVLTAVCSAFAHQPTVSDGTATDANSAIVFTDIQLSRVVYHEVTEDADQVWIKFDVAEPQTLLISLGVPFIERLESFRPAFAVLGSDLPPIDVELPFDVPAGLGGLVFPGDDVTDPEFFDEPFSGTSSWIIREDNVDLPSAGTYFIVGFVPSGETGKLWIAPGVREEFGLDVILELGPVLAQVKAFHEIDDGGSGLPCFLFPLATVTAFIAASPRWRRRSQDGAVM